MTWNGLFWRLGMGRKSLQIKGNLRSRFQTPKYQYASIQVAYFGGR